MYSPKSLVRSSSVLTAASSRTSPLAAPAAALARRYFRTSGPALSPRARPGDVAGKQDAVETLSPPKSAEDGRGQGQDHIKGATADAEAESEAPPATGPDSAPSSVSGTDTSSSVIAPPAPALASTPKLAAYGSARARAQRANITPDFPPFTLPRSFAQRNHFPESSALSRALEPISTWSPDHRDQMIARLDKMFLWMTKNKPSVSFAPHHPTPREIDFVMRWYEVYHVLLYLEMAVAKAPVSTELLAGLPLMQDLGESPIVPLLAETIFAASWLDSPHDPLPPKAVNDRLGEYLDNGQVWGVRGVYVPGISQDVYYHARSSIISLLEVEVPVKAQTTLTTIPESRIALLNIGFKGKPDEMFQGSWMSKSLLRAIARDGEADLVSLNSKDLAHIVGGYLGQDNAFSRGSISELGFLTDELAGRLSLRHLAPDPFGDDSSLAGGATAPPGIDSKAWLGGWNAAISASNMFREPETTRALSSSKEDGPDISKWDRLKAITALEAILQAASDPAGGQPNSRGLIVHIDDFIELSLLSAGRLLVDKLAALVHASWRAGKKIILVGTLAHSKPPEDLVDRLQDLSSTTPVINVPVDSKEWKAASGVTLQDLQEKSYLEQNLDNLSHVVEVMMPKDWTIDIYSGDWRGRYSGKAAGLLQRMMPQPTIYQLAALAIYYARRKTPGCVSRAAVESALSSFGLADADRESMGTKGQTTVSHLSVPGQAHESEAGSSETKRRPTVAFDEYEEKLTAGVIKPESLHTTFADVHVSLESKESVKTLTSLSLERPEAFNYGILATDKISGCLLYGPPGTGKTLLAKAVAKDSKAHVLEVSGASIRDMWAGRSEKNVRAIFTLARKLAPCVVFLDEADAILGSRRNPGSGNNVHRDIINQFLREWDGMSGAKTFVMIATNRPYDLDDAILRRVPRRILIDLPLQADREAILKILLKNERVANNVSLEAISKETAFFSGSDLKNLCVTAAMAAVKEEVAVAAQHTGPEPYKYPERRTLWRKHFDSAFKETTSSISEDMDSLTAIRKFDQAYGTGRKNKRKSQGLGFGVTPVAKDAEELLVRKAGPIAMEP